ncbi:hypothetical protein RJ639_015128 [Escallonia herrerae]|uniref:Uncharacterized protein n=1 Tax=Escallonia herrerae TaxID=1293975 RepID=A0AA88VI79_9ASTE|nr:hypothetical protein RJ639_015128 [Escallonia herrerae]
MGIRLLKKTCLLFLLISASLIVTSSAGRRSSFVTNLKEVGASHEDEEPVHERLLRANTKDYGSYDPAPTFVKPPFKLIPN